MPRRRRRRVTRFERRLSEALAVAVLVYWLWQAYPLALVGGLVAAAAVWTAVLLLRRERRRRTMRAPGERTWLYRHYDRSGQLLYVGITNNYRLRTEQHAAEKHWWWRVDQPASTVQVFPNRAAALLAEEQAIRAEFPLFNVVHNRRLAA